MRPVVNCVYILCYSNTKPEEKELEPEEKEVIKTPPESPKLEEVRTA